MSIGNSITKANVTDVITVLVGVTKSSLAVNSVDITASTGVCGISCFGTGGIGYNELIAMTDSGCSVGNVAVTTSTGISGKTDLSTSRSGNYSLIAVGMRNVVGIICSALTLAINVAVLVRRNVVGIGLAALTLTVNVVVLVGSYVIRICSAAKCARAIFVIVSQSLGLIRSIAVLTKGTRISGVASFSTGRICYFCLIFMSALLRNKGQQIYDLLDLIRKTNLIKQGRLNNANYCNDKNQKDN